VPEQEEMKRHGLAAAGNWLRDRIKVVERFPREEALALIEEETEGNGGGPYNLLVNLSRLGAEFPLEGLGLLGRDANAEAIMEDCERYGIGTERLRRHPGESTSYTIVVSVRTTGKRTFFHYPGSNALLSENDISLKGLPARYFYLGYLGMLDSLDIPGQDGETGAARVLRAAGREGMITVADLVSLESAEGGKKIRPCLPHVDLLFLNEIEAGVLLGEEIAPGEPSMKAAAKHILELGVRQAVLLHHADGVVACDREGKCLRQGSVRLPETMVGGAAGAGDALAAGVLLGMHEGWSMEHSLELGVCAAAMSLRATTCSEGIEPWRECLNLGRQYGYR